MRIRIGNVGYRRNVREVSPKTGVLLGLLFVIVGVALAVFSFKTITSYNAKNKTYTPVEATVVNYEESRDSDGQIMYSMVVEYSVDGQVYTKTSNVSSSMRTKSIGDRVDLKYNPSNPGDCIWVNDSTNIVLPIFSGIFVIVGIAATVSSAKKLNFSKEEAYVSQSESNSTNDQSSMNQNINSEGQAQNNQQVVY